jgi:GH15 family glucan-1,4-alpha-glucosidase
MCLYRDEKTNLCAASYDLWEEKWGINTFTASSVYGALSVAGKFASLLGKDKNAAKYFKAAQEIKEGILKYLYSENEGIFYKLISEGQDKTIDKTIDFSSIYGVYKFKVLEVTDERLKKAFEIFKDRLWVKNTQVGGIARYEGDVYHSPGGNIPGNPWLITTLWYVQYKIDCVNSEQDLPEITKYFSWVKDRALPSGVLPEQVNPYTGEIVSAAPLVWSHAEYVISVIQYLERLEKLGICKACYPLNIEGVRKQK